MNKNSVSIVSHSPEETQQVGEEWGQLFVPNTVIALHGDLGSGKTTLVKGIVWGAARISGRAVSSPTFTYLHIYSGIKPVYHFDLYRLKGEKDFLFLGFEEYFTKNGLCCIEWAEKIEHLLPRECIHIHLYYGAENTRTIACSNAQSL